jgi:GT2 family glycosyltransferase
MINPWLSIITITKDDPAGLARTVASAAALRAKCAEHIVVDGGSEHAAEDRIQSTFDDIRVVRRPPRGIADAFNAGVAEAKGEWLWFLNGGDRVDPHLNPEFLSELLGSSQADVVIGAVVYEGHATRRPHPPPHRQWPCLAPWIPHPASIIRRRLFEQFGGYDPRYQIAMDYDWCLRVLGRDVAVDLLDVPFAVFAPGGMSQRPEMRARLTQERDDIIRRHQALLWRNQMVSGVRLAKAWFRALFCRRLP